MLTLAQSLSFYKNKNIQKLILEYAEDKEIGVRYGDGFGKRPDILRYENDILEFAKKGSTSFHCSEELWNNPLQLNANMRRQELDSLRKGWDLILDIDCPYWILSKLITYVFIKALKDHGINSVTVKFSGGKGFHIAVPFEAFPEKITLFEDEKIKNIEVRTLFPEGPRRIAEYLLYYVQNNLISSSNDSIIFGKVKISNQKFLEVTGKKDIFIKVCVKCNSEIENRESKVEFLCGNCGTIVEDNVQKYMKCPKCNKLMEKKETKDIRCKCGSKSFKDTLDMRKIVEVDTVLISSRHLYRMPYSLHEKTGLVSMPFDVKHILKFEKTEAEISKIKPDVFLDRKNAKKDEAKELFQKAFDHAPKKEDLVKEKKKYVETNMQAIPQEYFPPCIRKISAGVEDGKKRALFILINFLASCGWQYDKIEEYVMEWNKKNKPDTLRETYIRGQLRYFKSQKEQMPPPNCNNRGYMVDTTFCNPDNFCKRIKNPAQYAKFKLSSIKK